MEKHSRKNIRLKNYDYNTPGYYFITVCTKNKQKILCDIVGTGVLDGPQAVLFKYGDIAKKHIEKIKDFYPYLKIEKYTIMPNHIHFLIRVLENNGNGPSGTPVPTNSYIAKLMSTFKRFCNKEIGENIWQSRSNDHIIRGEQDYLKIWNYIDTNPQKWSEDCFYVES